MKKVLALLFALCMIFALSATAFADVDLSKLPDHASDTLRLVRIGNYDVCACIGTHVQNTREIAPFKIISSDWMDGVWRVRFKLLEK